MRRLLFPAMIAILLLVAGCAHYQVNEQSREFDRETGYRFDALDPGPGNTDSLFVCLMFSGGGTRASALSYGIMKALKETAIIVDGEEKSLLDEVDCISSVSGGSFTAAYYGLFRENLFLDFRPEFLERNIQGMLAARLFNPGNWFRLASPYFSRIDMAAELYNREIFKDARFSQLEHNGRPLVTLNATNLGTERRFEFTQEYFDAMGSRLDSYPVSRAVAASSAFPYLLTPISLRNYPVAPGYTEPWWYMGALEPEDWTARRYNAARNLGVYLDEGNKYIHLMDGGLSDNIGARAVLDAYDRGFIRTRINQGAIDKLVLIVVNARTKSVDAISAGEKPPGFFTVAAKTATVAMDNYSYDSVAGLREELYSRVQSQKDEQACIELLSGHCPDAPRPVAFAAGVDPYVIEINFEAAALIPDEDPRYYLDLPTSFKLTAEQVDRLVNIGPKLLKASPQFKCLLKVLNAETQGLPRPEDCPIGSGIFP
ncbi:MAG: patatin-like phospholipase family protein [Syntrophales bacterium]|nr:patatin-like phospholipase family protein [Syntrophales bacterium]